MANKALSLAKWIPAWRRKGVQQEDLADDIVTGGGVPADGSITPAKLDRQYVESSYGAAAVGQPASVLGKIKRLWFQHNKVYGEAEDEF